MSERQLDNPPPVFGTASAVEVGWPEEVTLADTVVAGVLMVPGVARMHAGMFGEVATYLPGRRVIGVQIHNDATAVHVVLSWDVDIASTADLIREVVEPLVGTPVDITVQDLDATLDSA